VSVKIKDFFSNAVDYIFGDPIPAPEVLEDDPDTAWQKFQDATREIEARADFCDTRPVDIDANPPKRPR
jgi:hypothetical protein